jgi:hypothetical protein
MLSSYNRCPVDNGPLAGPVPTDYGVRVVLFHSREYSDSHPIIGVRLIMAPWQGLCRLIMGWRTFRVSG